MSARSEESDGNYCATSATNVSSFLHSFRYSRRRNDYFNDDTDAESIPSVAISNFDTFQSQFTVLEAMVTTMQRTGLSGPILLIGNAEFIGSGAQFAVYKQTAAVSTNGPGFRTRAVAVKKPKFDLDPDLAANWSDSNLRRNLHDMYLEVLALTIPRLREHSNIARLFGWGQDDDSFHSLPQLIMDLAAGNLESLLSIETSLTQIDSRVALCYDVSKGLDAIHECDIIHGDLKPANILVYIEHSMVVAKLADFGLCIADVEIRMGMRLGGTPGWRAPEVEAQNLLQGDNLIRADNYSYGLLLWRVSLHRGRVYQPNDSKNALENAMTEFERWRSVEAWRQLEMLEKATIHLLAQVNEERPLEVAPALSNFELPDLMTSEVAPNIDPEDDDSTYSDLEPTPYPSDAYFEWELSPIPSIFRHDLYDRFLKDPDSFPPDVLMVLFLHLTLYVESDTSDHSDGLAKNKALNVLCIAALNGSQAARAIMPAVYRSFREKPHPEVEKHMSNWLISATESGSMLASKELTIREHLRVAQDALDDFRKWGGYNQYFDMRLPANDADDHQNPQISSNRQKLENKLAVLVKYESLDTIQSVLREYNGIPQHSADPTTGAADCLVYYACVRGSWTVARQLLATGFSARWREPRFNLGCLHWVFAMCMDRQDEAIRTLLSEGAEIENMASDIVPLPFSPFVLPPGTALHWAIVLSCDQTIDLLLNHGADPLSRDGSDPYVFDDLVRSLDKFGGLDLEPFSMPITKTLGLTPLDYAAMSYSPHIFRAMRAQNIKIDVNDADEEGFTVLHRLSSSTIHRTRLGIEYSIEAVLPDRLNLVKETLEAILALGGNLEAFTLGRENDSLWTSEQYTPLMLAVHRGEIDVVECLLRAGANVHTQNVRHRTALHFLAQGDEQNLRCVKLLCKHGAHIHAADIRGDTPIVLAASSRSLQTVDYLLSQGADIDARFSGNETVNEAREKVPQYDSIFSLLAHQERIEPLDMDQPVANLLEKYVVRHPDQNKRHRVLGIARLTGTALLYRFAAALMPQCVKLLLHHGIDPNVKTKNWRFRSVENDVVVWYETPLDGLLEARRDIGVNMERYQRYRALEYERLCQRSVDIETLLRNAGGMTLLNDEDRFAG